VRVAVHFAETAMRARIRAINRRLVTYAFIVVVGLLGGRIFAAAWMFNELGWTATWIEISNWGPRYELEPTSRFVEPVEPPAQAN
jgi:hypothetical protein